MPLLLDKIVKIIVKKKIEKKLFNKEKKITEQKKFKR